MKVAKFVLPKGASSKPLGIEPGFYKWHVFCVLGSLPDPSDTAPNALAMTVPGLSGSLTPRQYGNSDAQAVGLWGDPQLFTVIGGEVVELVNTGYSGDFSGIVYICYEEIE